MLFRDLNEAQILALAITAEEEDARIYRDFAESLECVLFWVSDAYRLARLAGFEPATPSSGGVTAGHRKLLSLSYFTADQWIDG